MEVCDLMLSGMAFHKLAGRLKKESSFRNRSLSFHCLEYGKRFRCLTNMIVMGY